MANSPPQGNGWPVWMWEGGAGVVQNLHTAEHYGSSDFDNNLSPVIATALNDPSDFELYERDGGAGQGKSDLNGTTQTFMVLALAKELQTTSGPYRGTSLRPRAESAGQARLRRPVLGRVWHHAGSFLYLSGSVPGRRERPGLV